MASVKEIKNRIKSVQSTRQITNAMEIVSTTKFKKFSLLLSKTKPYCEAMNKILYNLSQGIKSEKNPLFDGKEEVSKIGVIVMTSDRGLCGGFNNNTLKQLEILRKENEDKEIHIINIGRKGRDYCHKRKYIVEKSFSQIIPETMYEISKDISSIITKGYKENLFDEVYIIFNEFISALQSSLKIEKIIPISKIESDKNISYVFEPSPEEILDSLLPKYITSQIFGALLNNTASEHSSRKNSMKSATDNADDMMKVLNLKYNRQRQSAITQEISEIVGGASAL